MRNARSLLTLLALVCAVLILAGCTSRSEDAVRPQTAAASAPSVATPVDRAAIEQVLVQATNDDVEEQAAKLMLEQLAVDSDYALTTWARGDSAGQALLRKEGSTWTVLAHDYGWMGFGTLDRKGVPTDVARRLLDQIDPNWLSYEEF